MFNQDKFDFKKQIWYKEIEEHINKAVKGLYSVIEKLFNKEFSVQEISVWTAIPDPKLYYCKIGQKRINRLFYISKGTFYLKNSDLSEITASKGDILYLPCDVEYISHWDEREEGHYISLNFLLFDKKGEPLLLSDKVEHIAKDKKGDLYTLFKTALEEYVKNQSFAYLRLQSLFYEVVYEISRNIQRRILKDDKATSEIYKAIIYLNDNYMGDVTTEQLAKMCGLSLSVFRRRFKANSGMSPMKYKLKLRLKHARQMLKSGSYTVSEISELLSCSDISHFNKLYNAEFSKNPSEDIPKN